ncbi:hypothetical protein SAMN02745218_01222 [Desulfofundulus australicus DSM 11792]|uniref:Uncharacterized protein n=1 Tax=Desulfofundulus australicus DSM 11792 TaxID=1121425 RepID=A0A1M4XZ94_9FIRM|nr:hypothetical protein [Desulfofundulus australicus]SHE98748.1 hypothetical protein SAMN02745218_01222 [Desulfofundulus australicus DSM 11792]
MRVGVTDHAVEQYRNKYLQYRRGEMTDEEIRAVLARVVERGRRGRRLPDGVWEYVLDGLAVVADDRNPGNITVITFLGYRDWRWWWRRKETGMRRSPKVLAAL